MAFCSQCGTKAVPDAKFCIACGAKLVFPEPQPEMTPVQQPTPQPVEQPAPQPYVAPAQPVPQPMQNIHAEAAEQDFEALNRKFAAVTVRYRCPNGHVFDGNANQEFCPECKAQLQKGGYIQMYRMGNYMGMAVGMGIYINGEPYGHLGNKQSVRISVPFGSHKVHVTHTTTRACNDPVLTVSPQAPYVWCKASFAKMGFVIEVKPAAEDSMPLD
jgi:hypothetical protein